MQHVLDSRQDMFSTGPGDTEQEGVQTGLVGQDMTAGDGEEQDQEKLDPDRHRDQYWDSTEETHKQRGNEA